MKAVRKFRATEWVRLYAEYKVMDWKDYPPNPLQHKSPKMTLDAYAEKGSDHEFAARRRCFEKYANHPILRQPWMFDGDRRTGADLVQ